jgi:hypothetical protein
MSLSFLNQNARQYNPPFRHCEGWENVLAPGSNSISRPGQRHQAQSKPAGRKRNENWRSISHRRKMPGTAAERQNL